MKNIYKPAFPIVSSEGFCTYEKNISPDECSGMSKRFFAACMAMQGLLANPYPDIVRLDNDKICEMSLKMADELLYQENEFNSIQGTDK